MKIIENSIKYGYPKRCRCERCQSLIEVGYENVSSRPYQVWSDVTKGWKEDCVSDYYQYFFCPVCGSEVDATKGLSIERRGE